MEWMNIAEILGLILGGGGIASFFTLRYERRRMKAESKSAENEATSKLQDVYQEMIEDVKRDRAEQKEYIRELKDDRNHLREERNELRLRIEETDEKVRTQAKEIARLGRRVDSLTPLICTVTDCPNRQRNIIGAVSDDSFDA